MTDTVRNVFRKNGVAAVTFQSGDAMRLPSSLFLERRLREGQRVDVDAYRAFVAARAPEHALRRAAKYLEARERSMGEVAAHLRQKAFEEDVVARTLAYLGERKLVSDERFAALWVDARSKKYGKARIAAELTRKGVPRPVAARALGDVDADTEMLRAVRVATRLSRARTDARKLTQALIRRGYSYSIAREAARAALTTERDTYYNLPE